MAAILAKAMGEIGRSARAAARTLALAAPAQKDRALERMAAAVRAQKAQILAANAEDLAEARSGGLTGAFLDRLALERCPGRGHGRRDRGGARPARPGRPRHRDLDAAERHDHRAGARAARRHRHHLREPAERHRRCRRAVPEIRQCRDPARRLRQPALEPRHPRRPDAGSARGRPAGGRDPARADPRPRRGRADAGRSGRQYRCDRSARRQEPGGARADRSARAGVRASGRRLPCLCRQGGFARHGQEDRAQRQDAAHRRVRRGRDAAGRSRRAPRRISSR